MSKLQGIISSIKELTVIELAELVESLQAEFGVSASNMGGSSSEASVAAPSAEAKTIFKVELIDSGAEKYVFLDDNSNPIMIDDVKDFHARLLGAYTNAMNEYFDSMTIRDKVELVKSCGYSCFSARAKTLSELEDKCPGIEEKIESIVSE